MPDSTLPPDHLKDSHALLSEHGYATSNTWYHGTSSALAESIARHGIKRSGDRDMQAATEKTMATIGNSFQATTEPVYLTPSKELAYYWAQQIVQKRSSRFGGHEHPVVFAATLPESLNAQVKPDVGAATLLLHDAGEAYMAYLAGIYQANNLNVPDIDLMKADRLEYLHTLGMAYINADIDAAHVAVVTAAAE
ncbi:hypothetical protein [Abyssibacter sp.]|uniref:hypothetical protein n=1 Tax=Abyssibacter sp. TaxID=2320200 RepID=UPI00351776E0